MINRAKAIAKHNRSVGKLLLKFKMWFHLILLAVSHLFNLKGKKMPGKDIDNSIVSFEVANAEAIPPR